MVSIDQAIESCTWVFQRTHYWTAKIQDGGDPPSWKLTWHHFSAVGDPMWMKFGRLMDNHMLTAVIWSTSKPEVEFQCSGRLFFQTGNSYISAVDWVITMKFGLLTDTDLLETASSPNPKPEVKLRRSGCHLQNQNHISAEDGAIWTKFRSLMQNDMQSTVIWSKSKPEVEFQYGGRLFFSKPEMVMTKSWIEI